MNNSNVTDDKPWFKQFWPWFLIILPGTVVIASLATVIIAFKGADDVVSKDYYKEGLAINHVATGTDALHVIEAEKPDIVILDLGLPDMDGLTVLRKLRKHDTELPVLLLTARDTLGDKISGLDSGADDYLAKPFDMQELLARLRALGRRVNTSGANVINVGDVSLDAASQVVTIKGEALELARREYMLLKVLLENTGKVQTRA